MKILKYITNRFHGIILYAGEKLPLIEKKNKEETMFNNIPLEYPIALYILPPFFSIRFGS